MIYQVTLSTRAKDGQLKTEDLLMSSCGMAAVGHPNRRDWKTRPTQRITNDLHSGRHQLLAAVMGDCHNLIAFHIFSPLFRMCLRYMTSTSQDGEDSIAVLRLQFCDLSRRLEPAKSRGHARLLAHPDVSCATIHDSHK